MTCCASYPGRTWSSATPTPPYHGFMQYTSIEFSTNTIVKVHFQIKPWSSSLIRDHRFGCFYYHECNAFDSKDAQVGRPYGPHAPRLSGPHSIRICYLPVDDLPVHLFHRYFSKFLYSIRARVELHIILRVPIRAVPQEWSGWNFASAVSRSTGDRPYAVIALGLHPPLFRAACAKWPE